jgi:Na+(H+)/acetate symporter ActP
LSKLTIASSIVPYQAGSSAQRIRIGLTGLAAAFIIVLFFSAITRSTREDAANNVNQASANQASEPLAELGVAPGSSESANNSSTNK